MSQYLSNEMKCCVKFQTAINSSRLMKHGNFRASRAADMYFNLKKNQNTTFWQRVSTILGFHSGEEADIKTEAF